MEDLQRGYNISQLRSLISRCLTFSELKYLLSDLYGPDILSNLPSGSPIFVEYCQETVLLLERRGLIDQRLFLAIFEKAPGRKDEITEIAKIWNVSFSQSLIEGENKIFSSQLQYKLTGFDFVQLDNHISQPSPEQFFSGYSPTWADLEADLDIRRSLLFQNSRIEYDKFKLTLENTICPSHVFVIFGEGGSGKTTFLRRLMYDLSRSGYLVFRSYDGTSLNIREILRYAEVNSDKAIYIFLDNAQYQAKRLAALSNELALIQSRTIIIAGARKNEWNERLYKVPLSQFEEIYLPSITESEALNLVNKLALHNSLGRLSELSSDDQLKTITNKASKQLLVGLLEATQGKRFRDIVLDEFNGIASTDSRLLYLAICILTQLGMKIPEKVAVYIAQNSSQLEFTSVTLPSLELVISRQKSEKAIELFPRHRTIGDELIKQICPSKSEQLKICFDVLERLSKVKSPHRYLKSYAARLASRIFRKNIMVSSEEAENLIELLLSVVGGQYFLGENPTDHSLQPQNLRMRGYSFYQGTSTKIPSQLQFLVAAEIARYWFKDIAALRLIDEGLGLNDLWNDLRLYKAVIEAERGNTEIAESLVHRILILADQNEGRGEIVLPISLAVDLAIFKSKTDPLVAIEYLKLADRNVRRGILDYKNYFLTLAKLYKDLNQIDQAISVLQRGLDFVIGPPLVLKEIRRLFVTFYSVEEPDKYVAWVDKNYPNPTEIESFVANALLKIYVEKRNKDKILNILERVKNKQSSCSILLNYYLNASDFDGFDFLYNVLDLKEDHYSAGLARALLRRSVAKRDKEATQQILSLSKDNQNIISKLLSRFLENEDFESIDFLRNCMGEGKLTDDLAAIMLKNAIVNKNEYAAVDAYIRSENTGVMVGKLIRQISKDDFTTFQFLETTFGLRIMLPDNAAYQALILAVRSRDKERVLDICNRASDFRNIISILKEDLSKGNLEDLAFLETVLEETGSFTDSAAKVFLPVSHLTQYRAIGLVTGRYMSSVDNNEGTIFTSDNLSFNMNIQPTSLWKKQENLLNLENSYCWLVNPKFTNEGILHNFQAIGVKTNIDPKDENLFSIRGQIIKIDEENDLVFVIVKPNRSWMSDFEPIIIRLNGIISTHFVHWFCDFNVNREGNKLVINWQNIIRLPDISG